MQKKKIQLIFQLLLNRFGPQHWWPADTPFEVMVGAVLTQQTSWKNVEKAIQNLKNSGLLSPADIYQIAETELAKLIKPAGFYNIKARRLKQFVKVFVEEFSSDIENMKRADLKKLREKLLSIKGIGRETADSILLYALNKPIFVVDAYTKRLVNRTGISQSNNYEELRRMFEEALTEEAFIEKFSYNTVYVFQEMHALIVQQGKVFCKKKPICLSCPIEKICERRGVNESVIHRAYTV